jgi:hypothetical protein
MVRFHDFTSRLTRCETDASMPLIGAVSGCSMLSPTSRRLSARKVFFCFWLYPIALFL